MIKKTLFFLFTLFFTVQAFSLNHDSVLNPDLIIPAPISLGANTGKTSSNPLISVSRNEFEYATCPSGWNYNGSSQYPLQARTVTENYINGSYVGRTTSAWYDMDASCTTTEYQQVSCPVNYSGVYYQSRQLSANDGWIDYSEWSTYGNSCFYQSPIIKKPGFSNFIITAHGVTFGANGAQTAFARIDNATGQWACYGVFTSYNNTPGDTADQILTTPFSTDFSSCYINGDSATVSGSCDSTSGGDTDSCIPATKTATIISRDNCNIIIRSGGKDNTYTLCQ